MNLHFKQALEELKYLDTIEGKAETFLRSTIDAINKSKKISSISSLCFNLYEGPTFYCLYSCCYYKSGYLPSRKDLCFSDPIFNYREINLIYEVIKNKLIEEGFKLQSDFSIPSNKKQFVFRQSFKIEI